MSNNILKAVEGLMRGICNQPSGRETVRVVTQEIDYDKLAEAIVRANKTAKEEELTREAKSGSATVLGSVSTMIFVLLGVLFLLLVPAGCYGIYKTLPLLKWGEAAEIIISVFALLFIGVMILMFLCLSIKSFQAANEVSTERDRSYVASLTGVLISLVALVVALVALLR